MRWRRSGQSAAALLPKAQAHPGSFFEQHQELKQAGILPGAVWAIQPCRRARRFQDLSRDRPWVGPLQGRFRGAVASIDGSLLYAIAQWLKITWHDRSAILPNCVLGVYDLLLGMLRGFQFDVAAARSEIQQAVEGLRIGLPERSLQADMPVGADRLDSFSRFLDVFEETALAPALGGRGSLSVPYLDTFERYGDERETRFWHQSYTLLSRQAQQEDSGDQGSASDQPAPAQGFGTRSAQVQGC